MTLVGLPVTVRVTHRPADWPLWTPTEADLADAWEDRTYVTEEDAWLTDSTGRRVKVVFPGRRWGGPGPDFRGAALELSTGGAIHGDVEIHRHSRDWKSHGHAEDPAYARVVLHVVRSADGPTFDAQEREIPTLVVRPERAPPSAAALARARSRALALAPCERDPRRILRQVEAAGEERFLARAARFEADLTMAEPDQVLWRGVAEALGFAQNAEPFGRLAEAVPWAEAAQVVAERGPAGLAGVLLGSAGLIGRATLNEARVWRSMQRERAWRVVLGSASWDARSQRARNAPAERCRGLAELAARWSASEARAQGATCRAKAEPIPCLAADAPTAPTAPIASTATLRRASSRAPAVRANRAPHPGPAEQVLAAVRAAAPMRHPRLWPVVWASPWIGRGRAQVIVINVLLPFAHATGVVDAAEVFERLASEPTNRAVRYMAGLLAAPGVRFRGARHQQGLLHLFKQACAVRLCETCPARHLATQLVPIDTCP